jgi:hypothetical protein
MRPPESATTPAPALGRPETPVGPHESVDLGANPSSPVPGAREPASVPSGGEPPVPAAPGEHLPPTGGQLSEPPPARVSAAPDGSPTEPVPNAAHPPQLAPAHAPPMPHAPDSSPLAGHSGELRTPHDGVPPGPGDGGGPHGSHPPGGEPQDPVHSHEPSGDGWHRLPDEPIDPHYGEPLPEHWEYAHNPADPSQINPEVRKLMETPEAPFGSDPQGHAYTQEDYEKRFNKVGPDGEHWYNFPGNYGAVSGTRVAYTNFEQFLKDFGPQLDRIGDNEGKYLAVMEDGHPASWEQRALHVDSLRDPYHPYTLTRLPDGWTIEVSEVAPGVGQPGGSIQVRISDADGKVQTVEQLIKRGVLR